MVMDTKGEMLPTVRLRKLYQAICEDKKGYKFMTAKKCMDRLGYKQLPQTRLGSSMVRDIFILKTEDWTPEHRDDLMQREIRLM